MSASSSPAFGIEFGGIYSYDPSRHAIERVGVQLGSSALAIFPQPATPGASSTNPPTLRPESGISSPIDFDLLMGEIPASQASAYYGQGVAHCGPRGVAGSCFERETFCVNSPHACITIAIRLLRNIGSAKNSTGPHCIHHEAFGTSPHLPLPIGNIFAAQYDAIGKILGILRCPCSALPSIRILLATICDRIVTEISTILGCANVDQIKLQPIRVGVFSSEGPLSHRVCASIFLENLQALQLHMDRLLGHPKSEQMVLYETLSVGMNAAVGQYVDTVVCEKLRMAIEQTRRLFLL
ncbi:unnamed protein product [Clonostachys solani]|uniref:Aflatoxin regulatory protein domain-containing protein n=1 Tax=Clonostachys solani TaxID=160281 RepID=A0A9N9VZD1_9HYPO|nr:unnamed protein product [Clonostachys solani]